PLPFVGEAVVGDGRLHAAIRAAFADWDEAAEDLRFDEVMARLAHALASLDRAIPRRPLGRVSARAAGLAREFLDANCLRPVASETLERITGISRFALARHFRACFGTSPHRYAVMRRLDHARSLLRAGVPLAQAAQDSAFADQSHMTRHFKNAYGVAPASWRALSR
ncbi:MAG: helix-turn-helix transcriptional regulator, partial [Proteobacteria bacterium]|nr:helix-turn-helix transcriptional regulator [Pseudomonadota bacterium]